MNCREAETQIFSARDGALDTTQRAALASHLAGCEMCRRVSEGFAAAIDGWRAETQQVRVPDAELEWQKLRREIRGGVGSKAAASRRSPLTWFAIPLAAAAAFAFALVWNNSGSETAAAPTPSVARATPSTTSSDKSSTVVFTDEKSGWTFVVAADDIHRG